MRIMAIDYGDAHTGVAISDPTGLLAGTTTTIHSRKGGVVLEELKKLVDAYRVEELVMGFPRNMDGTEGPRAQLYRDFAGQVEEVTGLKPVLWDERRTTVDAHRILFAAGQNAKKRKKTVDAVAASLILEGYLNFKPSLNALPAISPSLMYLLLTGSKAMGSSFAGSIFPSVRTFSSALTLTISPSIIIVSSS